MSEFDGRVVLVTGTSSGVGRAASVELARRGARVICAARREDRGASLVEEIRTGGGDARFVRTDLAEPASIDELFALIETEYGRLDGALNNAGTEVPHNLLPDIPLSDFDDAFAVNVRGNFLCMKHEMTMMRQQRHGSIVNVASLMGVMGMKKAAAYTASKHALVGLTKCAALDLADLGIRVNVICPGAIATEMMQRWTQGSAEAEAALASGTPLKRVSQPEEVAATAIWLLSDGSSYVTGLVMEVDGGIAAGLGA